jgi:hypothetical protein
MLALEGRDVELDVNQVRCDSLLDPEPDKTIAARREQKRDRGWFD